MTKQYICYKQINMDETISSWIKAIFESVHEFQHDYYLNKGLVLTEGDLECELYYRLKNNSAFNKMVTTTPSQWKTGFIHSQVTWFKPEKKSGYEVDLTVFNPENLDIETFTNTKEYPSKGFFFDGKVIAIELKFIRTKIAFSIRKSACCDYTKIVDRLSVAKQINYNNGIYLFADSKNTAYISIVVCKSDEIFRIASDSLLALVNNKPPQSNIFQIIVSHDKIEAYDPILKKWTPDLRNILFQNI